MADPAQRILIPSRRHERIPRITPSNRHKIRRCIDDLVPCERRSLVEEPRHPVVVGGIRDGGGTLRDERCELTDSCVFEQQRASRPPFFENRPQKIPALLFRAFAVLDERISTVVRLAVPPVVVAHAVVIIAIAAHPFGLAIPLVAFVFTFALSPFRVGARALVDF